MIFALFVLFLFHSSYIYITCLLFCLACRGSGCTMQIKLMVKAYPWKGGFPSTSMEPSEPHIDLLLLNLCMQLKSSMSPWASIFAFYIFLSFFIISLFVSSASGCCIHCSYVFIFLIQFDLMISLTDCRVWVLLAGCPAQHWTDNTFMPNSFLYDFHLLLTCA